MSEYILEAENLSKRYCRDLHRSLRYGLEDMARSFLRPTGIKPPLRKSEFWALNEVAFKLKKGESLGVVGRNGSGKSTLLKIINGTIKPTTGRVTIRGNLRLLALGVGFNPLLSGRENIGIACSLHGFSQKTTQRKFEEIVEFSELNEFIDAPIKTYSSGMYARLGFAIAIHTDPEILLVDEALAVGDLPFVAKCLRKIDEFREGGGSIVLVSHSGYVVRRNCTHAIWIDHGAMRMSGEMSEVCTAYEEFLSAQTANDAKQTNRTMHLDPCIESSEIECTPEVPNGGTLEVKVKVHAKKDIPTAGIGIAIVDTNSTIVLSVESDPAKNPLPLKEGLNEFTVRLDGLPFMRGTYSLTSVVFDRQYENQLAVILEGTTFHVTFDQTKITAGLVWIPATFSIAH